MSGRTRLRLAEAALELAMSALQVASLAYVISRYIVSTSLMVGPSMQPTFDKDGGVVLVEHVSHRLQLLQRGAVVTCISPVNPKEQVCKRVVAMAGDTVSAATPWWPHLRRRVTVPEGHVWLAGDNVRNSRDSRSYGPVPYALLNGHVVMQVWPPSRWQLVRSTVPPQLADSITVHKASSE